MTLDELIEKARGYKMSREEMLQQKASFVYGQMMDCAPHISKEDIERRIREGGK